MSHLDPEVVALLAMGEDPSADERRHLDVCADCAADVASFDRAVVAGRASGSGDALLTPPDRVWESIRAELSLPADAPVAEPPASVATPAHRAHRIDRRRRVRRRSVLLVCAGSAAATVAIVAGIWAVGGIAPRAEVVAEARLDGLPAWSGAAGDALLERADGHDRMVVDLEASVPDDGYREVWLLTSDATELVSLGVLDGASGTFDVPDDVDLSRFTVVDISQETSDGDPGHSGDSIVRGTLSGG